MYTAMMQYRRLPERLEKRCATRLREGLDIARGHDGFVRMKRYSRPTDEVLAIGRWKSRDHAEACLKTGGFRRHLHRLSGMTTESSTPVRGELRSFASAV